MLPPNGFRFDRSQPFCPGLSQREWLLQYIRRGRGGRSVAALPKGLCDEQRTELHDCEDVCRGQEYLQVQVQVDPKISERIDRARLCPEDDATDQCQNTRLNW